MIIAALSNPNQLRSFCLQRWDNLSFICLSYTKYFMLLLLTTTCIWFSYQNALHNHIFLSLLFLYFNFLLFISHFWARKSCWKAFLLEAAEIFVLSSLAFKCQELWHICRYFCDKDHDPWSYWWPFP